MASGSPRKTTMKLILSKVQRPARRRRAGTVSPPGSGWVTVAVT